jgi:predicted DNA-binding protein YlxM (UPF0122 family)
MRQNKLPKTPLQEIVGFDVAEEIYDQLPLSSQTILDLKMSGFSTQQIADCIGIPYTTVYDNLVRSRFYLAKLKLTLEIRQYYKETHTIVAEGYNNDET